MSEQAAEAAQQGGDWASVTIETTLAATALRRFLDDVERLYRINPLLEIAAFERTGGDTYRLQALNLSNGREIATQLRVLADDHGIEARYADGLKAATSFRVEPSGTVSRLVVTETYGGSEEERRARLDEVDLSLNVWGRALHDYLGHWARWSWLAPWRWYMARVWQPMRPSSRRIVFMIWVISLFEMVALAVIAAILIALGGLSEPAPS